MAYLFLHLPFVLNMVYTKIYKVTLTRTQNKLNQIRKK